ncbi:MAG: heparinase II/III family protein [Candidatus Sumerlaeota bacterium]|nr:heparinase II/III family protein [Candidatus Sumerlaeota bacterium]
MNMNVKTVCAGLAAMFALCWAAFAAELAPPPRPVDYDPAPLPVAPLPAQHPRIWFTAAEAPELRRRCQGAAKGSLDQIRRQSEDTRRSSLERAFDLAFLYQMTGGASQAQQAIALIRERKAFDWVGLFNSGCPYGGADNGMADPLACVFDWCFDQLNDADRTSIGGVLREELSHGPYRTRFHEPWWMNIWLSEILALHGAGIDDKLAADHFAAYNRSIHQFAALADAIHADGSMGDYQYQYLYFMQWPEMWLRATGDNLFKTCGFYRNQPDYLIYSLLPEQRLLPHEGDGGFGPLGEAHWSDALSVPAVHLYGWRNDNPHARWLAREMQNWKGGVRHFMPWQQIVWASDGGDEKPLRDLPPVKLFPSNQIAILRTGWDLRPNSTDTVAAFYCRPYEGHTHYDAGHFTIWRGLDKLAGDGGFYGTTTESNYHRNFYTRTVAHNCILIADPDEKLQPDSTFMTALDGGQIRGDFSHYPVAERLQCGFGHRGDIRVFVDDPRFTYLFADVTPAYNSSKATRVIRGFFFLKPATFLVADWGTSVKPNTPKRWLLHSPTRPVFDAAEKVIAGASEAGIVESPAARIATFTRGKSQLVLQALAPERAQLRRIGGPGYSAWTAGKNWEPPAMADTPAMKEKRQQAEIASRAWRIEIEPSEEAASAVFLNVLDITAADAPAPPRAVLKKHGDAVGAVLQRSGPSVEVLFYADGHASVDGKAIGGAAPE